jgi:hypothetical protein
MPRPFHRDRHGRRKSIEQLPYIRGRPPDSQIGAKPPAGGGARTWEFLCAVWLACFVSPCEEYKQVEVSLATVVVRETAVSNPSAPPASNVAAVLDPDRQKENRCPSPYKGGHVLPRGAYLG